MKNLVKVCLNVLLFFSSLYSLTAIADIYKCVIDGKSVYTNYSCTNNPIKILEGQKKRVLSLPQPIQNSNANNSDLGADSSYCNNLLEKLTKVTSAYTTTFEEQIKNSNEKKALTYQYEATCMTNSERDIQEQKRSNEKTERMLKKIERKQDEIQNRQRGYGY